MPKKNNLLALWCCSIILLLYFFPFFLLGENAYLTIHDNLDSDFHYLVLLKESKQAFNFDFSTSIPQVMNGLPRCALRSGLNLEVLSFVFLKPYHAFLLNFVFIHLIGFLGMYLFLRRYIFINTNKLYVILALSLCFTFIPVYMIHGISVLGQPLLLYAFLNIDNKNASWVDWLILIIFPFYSFFVWSGIFIWAALVGYFIYQLINTKQFHLTTFIAVLLLGFLYIVSEFQMIYAFFSKIFISHRTEYNYSLLHNSNIKKSIMDTILLFIKTQYHSGAYYTFFIFLLAIIQLFTALKQRQTKLINIHLKFLLLIGSICLFHGIYPFFITHTPHKISTILQSFQFDRFYFLLPFIWLWWFSLILKYEPKYQVLLIIIQFCIMVFTNEEWLINSKKIFKIDTAISHPSYKQFYAETLFNNIKNTLTLPQHSYRIICIGFHPAVAQHNGFYTLDSFQNNYVLSYKHQFREIIADELEKNIKMKNYFDAWGTRCYTFVASLPLSFMQSKFVEAKEINDLRLNLKKLKSMKGQYIFSTNPIKNSKKELSFIKKFTSIDSFWNIFVYKVI